jgi:citrate lyase subunit beta/citryl-CoA lyase
MIKGLRSARSWLFVPGDKPERFAKALTSGADVVVVDLEDAVQESHKAQARSEVVTLLRQGVEVVVRCNPTDTMHGEADLAALSAARCHPPVMLAKAEDPAALAAVHARGFTAIVPLIETASGVLSVAALAGCEGVVRLAFGHLDLCGQLALCPDDDVALAPARFALLAASAAHGLAAPVDGVCTEFRDLALVAADATASVKAGFGGKLCIHPAQVAPTHEAFRPTATEVEWARSVVRSLTDTGVAQVGGSMVDRPVLLRAQMVLARADSSRAGNVTSA